MTLPHLNTTNTGDKRQPLKRTDSKSMNVEFIFEEARRQRARIKHLAEERRQRAKLKQLAEEVQQRVSVRKNLYPTFVAE